MGDRNIQFDSDTERRNFNNELFNTETISKFIESSFNGNVLYMDQLDEKKAMKHFKTSQYIEKLSQNRPKLMKKIHRVSYGNIFAKDFKTQTIDSKLSDLELDEKLMIIDNVIDYLHVNFRELSPSKKMQAMTGRTSRTGSPARVGE